MFAIQARWGGHEISAFDHLRVVGRGGGFFLFTGEDALKNDKRGKKRERERMKGRSLLQFGADRGKMTTHLAVFSLVDSVCRASLRSLWSPWPSWPLMEFAVV